jgi:osmotically inducible protein OsmC
MSKIEQVLHSGNSQATINRAPNARRGEHGALDLKLSAPGAENREFTATGLHPRAEQLFSGAWSACYISAFEIAAKMKKVTLPSDYSVDIQVSIGSIAHLAHQICPYSKAVHGNIEVGLNVVTQ